MVSRVREAAVPVSDDAPARATVADVARHAGVSTATVDRVLNRRSGVRAPTARRVLDAALALRYLPADALRDAARVRPVRVVFLLPAGTNRYIRMLGDQVDFGDEDLAPFGVTARRVYVEGFDPAALADALLRHGRRADGVAFMALEHPRVHEAARRLAADGVHLVTMISDLSNSPRAAYVGIDNRAAGRTAAYLLGRFAGGRGGKVALIAGSRAYRGHEEREAGFLHLMEEAFPSLQVVGLREGLDDVENNRRQARALLAQYRDLVGIYNIGGASEGVGRALEETGRASDVVFIGHGLTSETRAMLIDGTMDVVITQSPGGVVTSCARILANLHAHRPALAGVEPVRMSVYFRENLP